MQSKVRESFWIKLREYFVDDDPIVWEFQVIIPIKHIMLKFVIIYKLKPSIYAFSVAAGEELGQYLEVKIEVTLAIISVSISIKVNTIDILIRVYSPLLANKILFIKRYWRTTIKAADEIMTIKINNFVKILVVFFLMFADVYNYDFTEANRPF